MAGGDVEPWVMARAQAGDPDAFATFIRHYDRRMRTLAFRILGNQAAMDDALQEAYVKAYRAIGRFRTGAAPGTWLYRIVYNACIDELRRMQRRHSEPMSPDVDAAHPVDGGESRVAERAALQDALAHLPADQRAAVVLVDAEGLDYAAAAEILGVAEGTVASRLSRARATLRHLLAAGPPDPGDTRA